MILNLVKLLIGMDQSTTGQAGRWFLRNNNLQTQLKFHTLIVLSANDIPISFNISYLYKYLPIHSAVITAIC